MSDKNTIISFELIDSILFAGFFSIANFGMLIKILYILRISKYLLFIVCLLDLKVKLGLPYVS